MVTSLTPVSRAIWACVKGTPSSSEARYRAPAAIPTGEFASRTFESFTWATSVQARFDRFPQDDRGALSEGRCQAQAGGEARELREAGGQGPLRPVIAGPLAHPAQAVQRGHAACVDRIPLRIP